MKTITNLLDTDQIHCYSPDGHPMPCNDTGQDASFTKSRRHLFQGRFRIQESVVEDERTGAVWHRDANPAEFPLTWREAQQFVGELNTRKAHGYDTWQLPSRRLLFSLISHQHLNPTLPNGHPFKNVFNGYYWTGDTCRRLPGQAWYVHLGGGRVHSGMKHGSYMVWPVASHGSQDYDCPDPFENGFFKVNGPCVHDLRTGLIWHGNADVLGRRLTWEQALQAVDTMNEKIAAGRRKWRLPNIRELESLVDIGSHSPALPAGHPFDNVRDAYWSSTTSVYEPRYAWTLYCRDGVVGVGYKPHEEFYAWPVTSEDIIAR